MRIREISARILVAMAATLAAGDPRAHAQESTAPTPHRWVYCAFNLQRQEEVLTLERVMTRAAAAGYNGIVLADSGLHFLHRAPSLYLSNLDRVRRGAAELKLEIVPAVMPIGRSHGILAYDPNLAEGLPVRDQLLVVHGNSARVEPDPPVILEGGRFDSADNHRFGGWDSQDLPSRVSFIDTSVKRSGNASLRIRDPGTAERDGTNCRVTKTIRVAPFRQYLLSAWIKTRNFEAHSAVRLFATATGGRLLSHSPLGVEPTQDWTEHHVLFNSLEHEQVRIHCGVFGGKQGTLWVDDVAIEETAFMNLLRRPGCPLTVSLDGGARLREGYEFTPLHDLKIGVGAWPGGVYTPLQLEIRSPAALRDGDRLRANYYHAVALEAGTPPCCLSEPAVFEILGQQASAVQRLLQPKSFFMSHSEIRVAGWCKGCQKPKRSTGRLLADHVRRCVEILRQINPGAEIFVWSDMFDPMHNAVAGMSLVNGTLQNSWEGLANDVTVVNWNQHARVKSLSFFARRGHKQILAGYQDGSIDSIAAWQRDAGATQNLAGVLYMTRQGRYDDLELFARHAWGTAHTAAGPRPTSR